MNAFFWIHPIWGYTLFALFTLLVGSFLNVVIHRLPIMLKTQWEKECHAHLNHKIPQNNIHLNLCLPRSHCPHCHHLISAWYNMPLISFLWLKGRCAYCNTPISWRYPLVELICMVLSCMALVHTGFHWILLFFLLFIWGMICLTCIDLYHQLLPDSLTLSLLWIGLFANIHTAFIPLPDAIYGAAFAYLTLWLFIKIFELLTGKIGMGQGDIKLFSALGAWFGPTDLPFILLCSSLTGITCAGIYLKWTKKTKDTPIPFGPFLCFSGLICLFYHTTLNKWILL